MPEEARPSRLPPGRLPTRTPLGAVVLDRPATLRDLEHLPPIWRGELIHGTIYAFPRPEAPHQHVRGMISRDLRDPFDHPRSGAGGWWMLGEPGITHPLAEEYSPDIAGWRRERLAHLPRNTAITVVPDWICEVLSPRTRGYDLVIKRRFYAEIGVSHLWYVDPLARVITASKLVSGRWVETGAWCNDERARIEPFEAAELDLSAWWEGIDEGPEDQDE